MKATSRRNGKAAILGNRKKPEPIEIDEDAVPESLKHFDRWLVWSWHWNGKRWDKPPLDARTGGNGSSTDRDTWCDFRAALKAVRSGRFDGLGFALGPDDGNINFAGVDFDDCRDPNTGEIAPDVESFIKMLDSYAEVSPSRTGVKVICLGKLPQGRRENESGTVEMYDTGRYFTITGAILEGAPRVVADRQQQLSEVYQALIGSEDGDHRGHRHGHRHGGNRHDDRDLAIAALGGLAPSRADNYHEWIAVGMALHSVSPDLLDEWDRWSRQSSKYIEGETARKWESFQRNGGTVVGLGTLIYWAKQDGWTPPRQARHQHSVSRPLTDLGNAERFAAQHGADVRFCHAWKKWLVWDGRRWALDDTGAIGRLGKRTVRSIYTEASNETDDKRRKALVGHAAASERKERITAMLTLAQCEQPLPIRVDDLDRHPWLLNVQNGTLDLRTGELHRHDGDDYLTTLAPVEYPNEPGEDPVLWTEFLDRVFDGNVGTIAFVQRLMGMALVGQVREHILPIFHGTGANGKSTVTEAFCGVLGPDYAMKAPRSLLMERRGEHHPTELADLHGKRFVAAVETDDEHHLAESLVKELVGGDTIRARRMREDFWQFTPSHTIVLATNHKPVIKGTDYGIWRRIRLVPFNVTIPLDEQDPELPEKLRAEYPAIMKWAVAGCLAWQRDGLVAAEEVTVATRDYRASQDLLGAFLDDCCLFGPMYQVKAGQLYARFKTWCEESGENTVTSRRFGEALAERGYRKEKRRFVFYQGIALRDDTSS